MPLRELKTEAEFDELLSRGGNLLVKFSKRNLEPSVGILPIANPFLARLEGKVPTAVVWEDEVPELFRRYYFQGIPCLAFFAEGVELYRVSHGIRNAGDLETLVDGYFGVKV